MIEEKNDAGKICDKKWHEDKKKGGEQAKDNPKKSVA